EGKTLKASLEEWEQTGRPQLGGLYGLAEQLFAGLCYAHHKGVAHRDIKPENIMLRDSGRLKLMDFGAAWGDKFVEVTRTGGGVCSLLYAAPECINPAAAKGKRDFRAFDQFSLGVVLYEMLAGVRPFADHDLLKMTPARPVRQHNPEVPEQLERVLARMLAFRPEQRFDDLHEARRAFEAAVSQLV
ncbi:MAG: serine/threonine protein kinase, partial [Candidatus Eremiobacteraeota bacterium]|nr:serine/threonine protein kinase [Candidatus Eremiobacteraeota bacterium]